MNHFKEQMNPAMLQIPRLKILFLSPVTLFLSRLLFQFHLLFLPSASLAPPPTHSLSLSPSIFTHHSVTHSLSLSLSLSLLTLPFLVFLHSFFPWLFWVPLPSLSSLLLLLKPRDAAHLTAAAVNRARLSPCVAATAAVNLVQTRCLFYSLALSRGRKKRKGRGQIRKQTGLLGALDGSLPLFTPNKKTRLTVGSGCCPPRRGMISIFSIPERQRSTGRR